MSIRRAAVIAVTAVVGIIGIVEPAIAGLSNVVFEFTFPPYETGTTQLILNGGATVLDATNTGWYDVNGNHQASNPDYLAGTCGTDVCNGGDDVTNDFFVFNLSNVENLTITSATLSLWNPSAPPAPGNGFLSILPLTYANWDVTIPIDSLIADATGATGTFADLGSGIFYGSTGVSNADNGTQILIGLDSAAFAAIFAAEGSQFAIGGSVTSPVPTIPEPLTLWVFGAGLAGAVAIRRRTRQRA